jgi:hypothetical protein
LKKQQLYIGRRQSIRLGLAQGKHLSIENDRKEENVCKKKKKNRKVNITREAQSKTKKNGVYTITKDNTSYELHLKKVHGVTS